MTYDSKVIASLPNHRILVLDRPAARKLIEDLTKQLENRSENTNPSSTTLKPPKIDEKGYISRNALLDFFAQVYDDSTMATSHAGDLHLLLIEAIMAGKLKLEVRCPDCAGDMQAKSCPASRSRFGHKAKENQKKMKISASGLRNLKLEEFALATGKVGPVRSRDFDLLRSSLQ